MIIDWASGANAQLLAYQWPVWNWSTGDGGAAPEPPVVAETYSGGWRHPVSRFETETETERKARIHADRIRLGIIAGPEEKPAATEGPGATTAGGPHPLLPPEAAGFATAVYDATLAEELARLHTGAYLDAEIKRYFRLLEDEDDAAVLLLAIATLH